MHHAEDVDDSSAGQILEYKQPCWYLDMAFVRVTSIFVLVFPVSHMD